MAYYNFLCSVSPARIEAFHRDLNESLQASRSAHCSHIIAYWVEIQPLGQLLGQAIDGGEFLHQSLWHPLRPPKIHDVKSIVTLFPALNEAWEAALLQEPLSEDDWYRGEISKVVGIFKWAHERKECVVSILPKPHDEERARRVILPKTT